MVDLVGAVDDATGTVPAAHFRLQEDAQGYFLVFRDILATQGVPLAVYRDRHGIFERSPRDRWSLEEKLAGQPLPTQVERCFQELGIRSIPARPAPLPPRCRGRAPGPDPRGSRWCPPPPQAGPVHRHLWQQCEPPSPLRPSLAAV